MTYIYICCDSQGETHFIVAEDTERDRSRIVDWDLTEDEAVEIAKAARSGQLTGDTGAEYCDDSITYPVPLAIEDDGAYDADGGRRSRCSWVAGVRTIRDGFRFWEEVIPGDPRWSEDED